MTDRTIRVAMWSGPRNISTAMMRAFENRPDTAVADEPFYAVYLHLTGVDHPLRDKVLESQPIDWRVVAETMSGPAPGGKSIFYQKHMTHHMAPEVGAEWMATCRNAFLIRSPERVLASYAAKREGATLEDIGVVRQVELFDRESDRLGAAPPVIDSADVLADPRKTLSNLCMALDIPFSEAMLTWPPGRRATDGVWAPAWYDQVERSTSFSASREGRSPPLTDELRRVAACALPYYERLARWALRPA